MGKGLEPRIPLEALADGSGAFVLGAKEEPRQVWMHAEVCGRDGTRTIATPRMGLLRVVREGRAAAVRAGPWTLRTGQASTGPT